MTVFSKLMPGTVQFGMNYGVANTTGKLSFDTVKEILKTAYDGGVTAPDTAPARRTSVRPPRTFFCAANGE